VVADSLVYQYSGCSHHVLWWGSSSWSVALAVGLALICVTRERRCLHRNILATVGVPASCCCSFRHSISTLASWLFCSQIAALVIETVSTGACAWIRNMHYQEAEMMALLFVREMAHLMARACSLAISAPTETVCSRWAWQHGRAYFGRSILHIVYSNRGAISNWISFFATEVVRRQEGSAGMTARQKPKKPLGASSRLSTIHAHHSAVTWVSGSTSRFFWRAHALRSKSEEQNPIKKAPGHSLQERTGGACKCSTLCTRPEEERQK
jgi:hypothetical protein